MIIVWVWYKQKCFFNEKKRCAAQLAANQQSNNYFCAKIKIKFDRKNILLISVKVLSFIQIIYKVSLIEFHSK